MDGVFFLRFRTFGSVLGVALSHYLGSKNLDKEPDQQDRFCPWKCKIWDCGWIHNPGPLTMMMMMMMTTTMTTTTTRTSACHLFWAGGLNHGLESVRGSFAAFSLLRGKQSWRPETSQSMSYHGDKVRIFLCRAWWNSTTPLGQQLHALKPRHAVSLFWCAPQKMHWKTTETISKHPDEPLWTGRI